MTAKEQLIRELETVSEPLIEELLDFLLFAQTRRYPTNPLQKQEHLAHKPIWQVAQELMTDVPAEIINQLPTDGAEQHDHYIYGIPKQIG
jgi:hypothetical protein